ncbi:E3 ubiquitin-protein ligase RNF144A isoform X2 [Schistocerca gregaria]|nr:E3 ubiquitin-protein ligase RNF144A isoform X2 [Schistocerca gregaria]
MAVSPAPPPGRAGAQSPPHPQPQPPPQRRWPAGRAGAAPARAGSSSRLLASRRAPGGRPAGYGAAIAMPSSLRSLVSGRRAATAGSSASLYTESTSGSSPRLSAMRKCETVLALAEAPALRPVNRLRVPPPAGGGGLCSRCSSLLSLASSSRYSLNTATASFVPQPPAPAPALLCKLCLQEVPPRHVVQLADCACEYCIECMKAYLEFEIQEGAYEISCPDAQCEKQGVISISEMETLVTADLIEKHKKFRLNREVDLDVARTWCPRAGCETVCSVCPTEKCRPQCVHCPTCADDFCSNCRRPWHPGVPCEQAAPASEPPGIPFDSDLIKCCPMCNVPIEKDEGCAQMMCKRCKHVFCWYCLASLDDDFLLRHYDKGPCKNKLGHSRASVIWHRTQVIGIFAGFGILLLVASPLLLLAAPCIVCCKCRICSGGSKLDSEDELPDESAS